MKEKAESGRLFDEAKPEPKPGEKGYLDPRFHWNEKNEIVDAAGNVYDENYNLIREAPTKELKQIRKQYPDASPIEHQAFVRYLQQEKKKKQRSA